MIAAERTPSIETALPPRTRVALFITDMTGGGAERTLLNLAGELAARGYAVDVVLVQARGDWLPKVPPTVRLVVLGAKHTMVSLPALTRYLRREKPAALLSFLNQPNVVAAWAKRLARTDTKIVISVHNTLSVESRNGANTRLKMMPFFVKRFYAWADEIVAVSRGVADDLAQMTRIPRERIQVIYNPHISPDVLERARDALAHPWFVPGAPPVVLAVGRLHPQKDFPTLLRAFAQVRRGQNVRLLILGEGEDRGRLEALAAELGVAEDVCLPGFVSSPFAYMSRAALYVLSSRWEGLPSVLVEALACGCPVVSTDCPSGPRELLADGRNGRLVPVGDVEALAAAIRDTLNGQAVRSSAEALQPFTFEHATDRYTQILSL